MIKPALWVFGHPFMIEHGNPRVDKLRRIYSVTNKKIITQCINPKRSPPIIWIFTSIVDHLGRIFSSVVLTAVQIFNFFSCGLQCFVINCQNCAFIYTSTLLMIHYLHYIVNLMQYPFLHSDLFNIYVFIGYYT